MRCTVMDFTQVILAIVGAIVTLATLYSAYLQNRAKADAEAAVAAQAERDRLKALADAEIVKQVAKVAVEAREVKTDLKAAQAAQAEKGDETLKVVNLIHILVNSDMTAARNAERDSARLLVIALERIAGDNATNAERKEIARVKERITELDQILADRLAAQTKVDEEAGKINKDAGPDHVKVVTVTTKVHESLQKGK